MTIDKNQQRHINKFAGDSGREKNRWKSNKENWTPYNHNKKDNGAGKGDNTRPSSCSPEVYGLRYDLATGRITMDEFTKRMEELNG